MKDIKRFYTIGEAAALLNMSTQTLRFYDKSGVVVPHYIDPKTGYRYYSYDQIPYIGRVKYLQRFGLRLEDIRTALASNDVRELKKILLQRREDIRHEVSQLNDMLEDLDWYVEYYSHIDYQDFNDLPYKVQESERYLLAEPIEPGEKIYGAAGHRLIQRQYSAAFANVRFLRHNGYLLDFQSLLKGQIVPTHYFVYLREKATPDHPNVKTVPAGTYFCMQARILSEPFDNTYAQAYFKNKPVPGFVLANEYEDNFKSFRDCIYEVQILISSF